MTIDPEFLRILACPATRQPLRPATAAELQQVNAAIGRGGVLNRAGSAVSAPLQAGLVPEDGKVVYPILDDIPILLTGEAIPLQPGAAAATPDG